MKALAILLAFGLTLSVVSCSTTDTDMRRSPDGYVNPAAALQPEAPKAETPLKTSDGSYAWEGNENNGNAVRLEALWNDRVFKRGAAGSEDFELGPGDMLRISVPLVPELQDQTIRISEDDSIVLPLVGSVAVNGMTEERLRQELVGRLSNYMYNPQVEVFLKQTEHRQVAVLGAVKTPGRYMLSSEDDTIMMMISRAGGLTQSAASKILLIPARPARNLLPPCNVDPVDLNTVSDNHDGISAETADGSAHRLAAADGFPMQCAPEIGTNEVSISMAQGEGQRYLSLPAHAGDVIIVPPAGEITVQGWVDKPGAYKVTPGLTALGAIAAAGGANFTSSATLLRESESGKIQMPLDLPRIRNGEQADVQMQSGDVVIVEKSVVGAVPYALYFALSKLALYPPLW